MSTIDDKKNGRQPIVYGDVKGFLKETVTHIVYVVLWGIGGAFLINLVKAIDINDGNNSRIDIMLPTDLDNPPYKILKETPMKLGDVIHKQGVHKLRAMLEWIYPMNHSSFPYNINTNDDDSSNTISQLLNAIIRWLVNSCSYAFSSYRSFYKCILVILSFIPSTIIFYCSPFIILFMSFTPTIILFGIVFSIIGAIVGKNKKEGLILLLAPLFIYIHTIVQFIKNPFKLLELFTNVVIFCMSWSIYPIILTWYFWLSVALWIYAILFFICSPLTQEGGVQSIKESIGLHWKGLTILFLGLVTKSALIHLSSTLFTGVTFGVIISLILLYRA